MTKDELKAHYDKMQTWSRRVDTLASPSDFENDLLYRQALIECARATNAYQEAVRVFMDQGAA